MGRRTGQVKVTGKIIPVLESVPSSVTQVATIEVAAYNNILRHTADFIFDRFRGQAPDFSNIYVLLPHKQVIRQFNDTLCHALPEDLPAIIPPWSGTLGDWTHEYSSSRYPRYQIINEHARQLLFIEALQQHPDLFKEENKWQVTQSLLNLFDELSLNQADLFSSAEGWHVRLRRAYGIEQQDFEHLQYESKLVYTLWHAWQTQLKESELYDETTNYISRLSNAPAVIEGKYFICLGLSSYTRTEQEFINLLVNNQQCQVIEYSDTMLENECAEQENDFSAFICEAFSQSPVTIKQRAKRYTEKHGQAFSGRTPFSTYMAGNEEQQVRAIDYFIRSNLIQGNEDIAIISEDRKLSRRLRALLERADVQLQDRAGWSLATTQASTIIERWLQCIEEDFSAYPLLDCLKSPFLEISSADADFRQNIYRFEHDLIFHENVSSNIPEYKKKLKERLERLSHWPRHAYRSLTETLDYIADSASSLSELHAGEKTIRLSVFIDALLASLEQLGVMKNFQHDEAGLVILQTFDSLKQSISYSDPELHWQDCRQWLGMALETQHFTPPTSDSGVKLMTLEQSSYQHFDCVIIAATESQHFPGSARTSPFFNQAVRDSLGLDTWEKQRTRRHELFNRALLSSAEVLLTACNEDKGEKKPVSPWLELLSSFYQLAYERSLENQFLHDLVLSNNEVFNCDDPSVPEQSQRPEPAIPAEQLPEKISASSYQRIINCPYQYLAADALGLKPLEELSEELKKSDYGKRIHLILQVFHSGHKKYGDAFTEPLTDDNRSEAQSCLNMISEKIFLQDLDNNVLHRSWLYRWQKHIPSYIDWQLRHQRDWAIFQSEKLLETELDGSVRIYGFLDRVDRNRKNNSHAIIDYKTGITARQEDVDSGENVQLSIYALLDDEASDVSYLSVDSSQQKIETRSCLSGEDLEINREHNRTRLLDMFDQMKNSASLTAWGDDDVCCYCNFSGLCRKDEWTE
jgi:ATP-dependent helicase/nuclease subunit B